MRRCIDCAWCGRRRRTKVSPVCAAEPITDACFEARPGGDDDCPPEIETIDGLVAELKRHGEDGWRMMLNESGRRLENEIARGNKLQAEIDRLRVFETGYQELGKMIQMALKGELNAR